jgi:hypothetical protein
MNQYDRKQLEKWMRTYKWVVLGFLTGAGMGAGLSVIMMMIYNFLVPLFGGEVVKITWAGIWPVSLIFGLAMAINVLHPPFGD